MRRFAATQADLVLRSFVAVAWSMPRAIESTRVRRASCTPCSKNSCFLSRGSTLLGVVLGQAALLDLATVGGVLEELLDQVDVCHYHTPAAVSFASKLVHGISIRDVLVNQSQVALPEISSHLPAGEAANGNDHLDNQDYKSGIFSLMQVDAPAMHLG